MLKEIGQKISKAKEDVYYKKKWEKHLQDLLNRRNQLKKEVSEFRNIWEKEKKDVEKLEKVTLTNIFYSFIGRKLEKEDKERQEEAAARIKYESHVEELEAIETEIFDVNKRFEEVKNAEEVYQQLLKQKENLLIGSHSSVSVELDDIDQKIDDINLEKKEIGEAIQAGRVALRSLEYAQNTLKSAEGWSTFDMLGGGMLSTFAKRSKLDEAEQLINRAQINLRKFQMELEDINEFFLHNIQISGFLSFADYFFDNIFVDWSIHGKIQSSIDNVSETSSKVQRLLFKLEEGYGKCNEKIEELNKKRNELIEQA